MIPELNVFMAGFIEQYDDSENVLAPLKMNVDGFITLFLYNGVCILVAWFASFSTFFFCVLGVKILKRFEDFS
jgi:hypothetical protein